MLSNNTCVKSVPFLFIYIPTFNRVKLLERQLAILSSQISDYLERVRILVSINDASNPEYESLISKYASENISFRENPGNIGGNPNITLGFIFAKKNDFLWILSDDDMILPKSLNEIFSVLSNDFDIVHIGEYQSAEKLTLNLDNFLTLPKGAGFGMISAAIFNIKSFSSYIKYGFEYLDSSFPHLAILMAALKDKKNLKMGCSIHKNVFSGEVLNTHGTGEYGVSALGFGYLADFLPRDARAKFLDEWLKCGWRGFLDAKDTHKVKYNKAFGYHLITYPKFIYFILTANLIRFILNIKNKTKNMLRRLKC